MCGAGCGWAGSVGAPARACRPGRRDRQRMGNESSMPCSSGRGDPGCGALLDCQSSRAPVPMHRQPPEYATPQRGINRLGGVQPAGATYTTVGGGATPIRPEFDGRENQYENGRPYPADSRGKVAFQPAGPTDPRGLAFDPGSRAMMDLQDERRRQSQQTADEMAEKRRLQAEQALQQAQAQQQVQREQMAQQQQAQREQMERERMARQQQAERQAERAHAERVQAERAQAEREQAARQQAERDRALLEREEVQREQMRRQQHQQQQQQQQQQQRQTAQHAPSEPEPHWVRKVCCLVLVNIRSSNFF